MPPNLGDRLPALEDNAEPQEEFNSECGNLEAFEHVVLRVKHCAEKIPILELRSGLQSMSPRAAAGMADRALIMSSIEMRFSG